MEWILNVVNQESKKRISEGYKFKKISLYSFLLTSKFHLVISHISSKPVIITGIPGFS